MLPIFLELNTVHLIGSVLSVILPFSFFPFGVYLAYIYYATSLPARSARRGPRRRLRRAADVPARRAAAREAGRRARLLLQLRRRLEQLLPAVRRPRELEPVPDHRRTLGPALRDAVVQPVGRRGRPVGPDLQARARARDPARRRAGGDRLPLLAARARPRDRRRSGEGVSDGQGCVRGGLEGLRRRHPRRRQPRPRDRRRRVRGAGRPVRLREDDGASDGCRARGHQRRRYPDRRPRRQRPLAEEPRHRDGLPELRPLPAPDRRTTTSRSR